MMKFDKKIFKKHYGSLYFKGMYWGFGIALLFLQLIYYPSLFGWTVAQSYIGVLAVCMTLLLISIGVSGFLYFDRKRLAKNQQQWIDQNCIFYRLEKRRMLTLKSSEPHVLTYQVQSIKELKIENAYLTILGKIHLTDESDDVKTHYYINQVRIPRCFTNEEKIIRLSANKKRK